MIQNNHVTLYNSLGGVKTRLNILRKKAEHKSALWSGRLGKPVKKTWKHVRYCGFHNAKDYYGWLQTSDNGKSYYCGQKSGYFNRELYADEILGSNHSGYFADIDCNEIIQPFIVRLSRGRFLAALEREFERVYFGTVFYNERDAALYADKKAQSLADVEREYRDAERVYNSLLDEIENHTMRLKEYIALRNKPCFQYARGNIKGLIETIRKKRNDANDVAKEYDLV